MFWYRKFLGGKVMGVEEMKGSRAGGGKQPMK
jgi:hypothetical protein